VVGYEALQHHHELLEKYFDEYDPFVSRRMKSYSSVSEEDQQSSYRDKAAIRQEFDEAMGAGGFDAVIYPTTPCIPPKIEDAQVFKNTSAINVRCLTNTATVNNLDGCSISLPMHTEDSAPTGLMVSSVHGDDEALYGVSAGIEGVLD
jgi:aspartyl-tRNA(Asn)/glutamyl-tRNA(Gln) amidotransferase subunit A